jgi:ubiquinone/menaquinone biosynthesis C-methylase UbiE
MFRKLWFAFVRFAFHHFYNTFAFTYDFVSAVVSRGHWRAWTRAAIPRIVGKRVLEIPCGTGNLMIDICAAGYASIGVDLSPSMLRITRGKMRQTNVNALILRARAQALPFPNRSFDSIVMTFPPGFVYDPTVLSEFRRLLADDGRLIWVDAGRLLPHDFFSRLLNRAFDAVGGNQNFSRGASELLTHAGLVAKIETVCDKASVVMVAVAEKVEQ